MILSGQFGAWHRGVVVRSIRVEPVSFRLKRPFVTSKGRKITTHNVQICLLLSCGARGFGEASTSIAKKEQSQARLIKVLRTEARNLSGRPILERDALIRGLWKRMGSYPAAAAALECAVLDALHKPLWRQFGSRAKTVETDLTLSVGHPDAVAQAAQAAVQQGFRRMKVKLSGDPKLDWIRLKAVHAVAPQAKLVADGNQGFTLEGALELDRRLNATRVPVFFFEQPFPRHDVKSMKAYRKKARLPLVADESVQSLQDAERLLKAQAIDGINVKVAKSGVLESLAIAQLVRKAGKILSIGCMEESKRGLAASVHLACGAGFFDWVDLDSAHLLKDGNIPGGFTMKGPFLSV